MQGSSFNPSIMASSTTTHIAVQFVLSALRLIPLLLPLLVWASFFRFWGRRKALIIAEQGKRNIVDLNGAHMVSIFITRLSLLIRSAQRDASRFPK
jgi:hypothetical protein